MDPLLEADANTKAWFLDWLDRFAACVRAVDYAAARPLFHPGILAFGTFSDILPDREAWISRQWDNVWPRTDDFCFTLSAVRILASQDQSLAVVIAPWTSTGFHEDGTRFDRPGRATIVFQKTADGWVGVHSHLSLNKGVPQSSHASRPVKSR